MRPSLVWDDDDDDDGWTEEGFFSEEEEVNDEVLSSSSFSAVDDDVGRSIDDDQWSIPAEFMSLREDDEDYASWDRMSSSIATTALSTMPGSWQMTAGDGTDRYRPLLPSLRSKSKCSNLPRR